MRRSMVVYVVKESIIMTAEQALEVMREGKHVTFDKLLEGKFILKGPSYCFRIVEGKVEYYSPCEEGNQGWGISALMREAIKHNCDFRECTEEDFETYRKNYIAYVNKGIQGCEDKIAYYENRISEYRAKIGNANSYINPFKKEVEL